MMTFLNSETATCMSYNEVLSVLQSDSKYGLSEPEVLTRRKLYSYNEFEVTQSEPLWRKYLDQFKEPMILLLLASACISIVMRQFDDAISITCVSVSTILNSQHATYFSPIFRPLLSLLQSHLSRFESKKIKNKILLSLF